MPISRVSFNHICSCNMLMFGACGSVIGNGGVNTDGYVGKYVVDDFDRSNTKIK